MILHCQSTCTLFVFFRLMHKRNCLDKRSVLSNTPLFCCYLTLQKLTVSHPFSGCNACNGKYRILNQKSKRDGLVQMTK